jgi:nucleotide-binding universal stress UspA family protein
MMFDRLLFALDQYESGQTALRFTTELARESGADVRVFHARKLSKLARVPPIERPADARLLVEEAVLHLRISGIGAEGRATSVVEDRVANCVVQESVDWNCDAIILGSRRLRGISRLAGWNVRERILRASPLPVITAPTTQPNGVHSPRSLRDSTTDTLEGVRSQRE